MFKVVTLLAAMAIVASASVPSDAKNSKGCKRTNVRPANPQGSVLVQPSTGAAAAGTATPTAGDGVAPVMVFGSARPTTDGATAGTVVPGIASEPGPTPGSVQRRRKARRSRRSAAVDTSSLPDLGAIAASSSC